jgi:uncharacterized damage-inducible protein DinB
VPCPPPDAHARGEWITRLADAPDRLRAAVAGLPEDQLDSPYRRGGWSVRQVVHHVADSHLNWYVRTRLALTGPAPEVEPYGEARWAELYDARTGAVEPSLLLLDGVHRRWAKLFRSLTEEQWKRRIIHPDRGVFVLDATLPMHVWHVRHHAGHIEGLRSRHG